MEKPSTSKSASEDQRKSCPEVFSSSFETSATNFPSNSHLLDNPFSKRCSSLVPGGNLHMPSTCSLSPICRGSSTASECEVGFDLEDSVFLSPKKSARVFAPSTVREEPSLFAREATFTIHHHPSTSTPSRLLCLFSWILALPLLTLGVTFALDLPSIATDSLTAAIFLSVLVLVAALLSVYVRTKPNVRIVSPPEEGSPLKLPTISNLENTPRIRILTHCYLYMYKRPPVKSRKVSHLFPNSLHSSSTVCLPVNSRPSVSF